MHVLNTVQRKKKIYLFIILNGGDGKSSILSLCLWIRMQGGPTEDNVDPWPLQVAMTTGRHVTDSCQIRCHDCFNQCDACCTLISWYFFRQPHRVHRRKEISKNTKE